MRAVNVALASERNGAQIFDAYHEEGRRRKKKKKTKKKKTKKR